jgi:outer membrane murein-binding lipoprotein Lpp
MKKNLMFVSAIVLAMTFTACGPSEDEKAKMEKELTESLDQMFDESMKELDEDVQAIEEDKPAAEETKKTTTTTTKKPAVDPAKEKEKKEQEVIQTIKQNINDTKQTISTEGTETKKK